MFTHENIFLEKHFERKNEKEPTKLTFEHLASIGPVHFKDQAKERFELAEKTKVKYNKAICTAVTILSEAGKNALQAAYHRIHGLPHFVHRFLQGRPSLERALFVNAPQMYHIFDTPGEASKTILMSNPEYIDHEKFLSDIKTHSTQYAVKQLKDSPHGLTLVTWYLHPQVLPDELRVFDANTVLKKRLHQLKHETKLLDEDKKFNYYRYGNSSPLQKMSSFSKLPRTMSQQEIREMESKSAETYLACMFDLDSNVEKSLNYLKSLRTNILHELESVYGVTKEDKIKIYLHMPYLDETTTLHFHIRINQGDHELENAKSFGLNEIIKQLESGLSVSDMINERGTIYCTEYPIGRNIDGINVETVPNPKRNWSDVFKRLSTHDEIQHYLFNAIQNSEVLTRMQLLDFEEIEKLTSQLTHLDKMPDTYELIEMIKKLSINPELEKLGWSLRTGECEIPIDINKCTLN